MTTENWIALFFILLVPLAGLILTFRHRLQEALQNQTKLEEAYKVLDLEISQRTQNLRALNNSLYGEIDKLEKTEERLYQSEGYLHSIIDSMPSVLIGVTREGIVTHWNYSAEQTLHLKESDVLGKTLWEVSPHTPIDIQIIRESIDHQTPKKKQNYKIYRNDETHYLDIAIYPLLSTLNQKSIIEECIIQIDDVTVQVMMETMMIQNEKMLSLGELAAGMAHEINNPLGAILQSVQNIERRLSTDLPQNHEAAIKLGLPMAGISEYIKERQINKFLANIRDAGERSARIVSNMLEFSHQSQQHSAVDINELTIHCLELADNQFYVRNKDTKIPINIVTSFDQTLPKIMCSPAEIQQVLLNLLRNASQCFSKNSHFDNNNPSISISTECKDSEVEITISDNGPGIPENICRHIFEPFFTTKEIGQGTGLGLSISYFIITEHHGGNIRVNSTVNQGSAFIITLPLQNEFLPSHGNF